MQQVIERQPDRVTEMLARVRIALIRMHQSKEEDARRQVAKAIEIYPQTSLSFLHRSRPYKDSQIYEKWDPIWRSLGMPE